MVKRADYGAAALTARCVLHDMYVCTCFPSPSPPPRTFVVMVACFWRSDGLVVVVVVVVVFRTLLLSRFWTSRGHRLLPPRFLPSIFIARRV